MLSTNRMVLNQQARKGEGTDRVSQVVLWLTGSLDVGEEEIANVQ